MGMMNQKARKTRSDRNHVIYAITNQVTGEQYIGLTVLGYRGSVKRTLHRRMQKHVQRALAENKGWALSQSLREYGAEAFVYGLVQVVRGKAEAHVCETALIKAHNPQLNTFK
jgi:hypothetical protein